MGDITRAARMGLRLGRRRRAFTLVACLAVAVPVLLGTTTAAVAATAEITPAEAQVIGFGAADGLVSSSVAVAQQDPARVKLISSLPAGSLAVPDVDLIKTPVTGPSGRTATVRGRALDVSSPVVANIYVMRTGSAKPDSDTIVLSRALAAALHVHVGDTVRVGSAASDGARVTGLVIDRTDTTRLFFLVPSSSWARDAGIVGSMRWFVKLPRPIRVDVSALTRAGFAWRQRTDAIAAENSHALQQPALLMGLGVLAEVTLLISAVLTVVVRGQRRDLGLLATLGAPSRVRSGYLWVYAGLVAVVGTTAGVGMGEILARALISPFQRRAAADWGDFDPAWATVAVLVTVTATATVATVLVPTRRALNQDVITLLSDVDPLRAGHARWWAGAGVALIGLGALSALGAAASGEAVLPVVSIISGVTGSTLSALSLTGRLAQGPLLPVPTQLRSAVRACLAYPGRTVTTITALATVAAVAVIAQVLATSIAAKRAADYTPMLPQGTAVVVTPRALTDAELGSISTRSSAPDRFAIATIRVGEKQLSVIPRTDFLACLQQRNLLRNGIVDWSVCARTSAATVSFPSVGVADAVSAQHMMDATWTPGERDAYERGDVIAAISPAGLAGEVTLIAVHLSPRGTEFITVGARRVITGPDRRREFSGLPAVLMAPGAAAALHLIPAQGAVNYFVRPSGIWTDTALIRQLPEQIQPDSKVMVDPGPPSPTASQRLSRFINIAAGTTTAVIVMSMLGLWVSDMRRQYAMMGALGASRRWQRMATALLGSLLTVLAAVMGTVWGLLATWRFLVGLGTPTVIPVDTFLTVVGSVLVGAVCSAALAPRRAKASRRL